MSNKPTYKELEQRVKELEKESHERKRAEEALRESEERFRRLVEHSKDAFFLHDFDGRILDVNQHACDSLGYTREELLGLSIKDIDQEFIPFSPGKLARQGKQMIPSEPITVEGVQKSKDGTTFPVEVRLGVFESGERQLMLGLVRDITGRKQAEQALKDSERRFQDLALSSADWIWEVDRKGRYTFASGRVKEILGYDPGELIGKTPFDLMSKEEAEHIGKVFEKIASEKKPIVDLENWNLTKEGGKVCLLTNGVPILGEKGELSGYRGVDKDITERKQAEEALKRTNHELKESEQRYRTLVDNIDLAVNLMDSDHNILMGNAASSRMLKKPTHEIIGKKCFREFEKRDAICPHCPGVQTMASGQPAEVETVGVRDDQSRYDVRLQTFPIFGQDGKVTAFIEIAEDITERKQMEKALRESEEDFRALAGNANDGIIISGKGGSHVYANKRAGEITGYSIAELTKISLMDLVHPDEIEKVREIGAKRIEGKPVPEQYETVFIRKNGKSVSIELAVAKTAWHGQPVHIVAFRDITERKRAEQEIENTNRRLIKEMREKEEFLRIVSHDLGAPVRNISGIAASIVRKYGESMGDDVKDRLARVQRNAEHELGLIQDLLELSRIKTRRGRFEEVDLGALVKGIGDGLSNQLEEKGIRFKIAENLPTVFCERNRMMQVFQNLIDNACKYMDSNKNPRIEVGFEELDDSYRFFVSDNGIGIREEDQERIFYVFNRVRNPASSQVEGKGVGLSAVKAIVEAYGGEVWVESPPKGTRKGSRFYFTLAKEALGRETSDEGRSEHSVGG